MNPSSARAAEARIDRVWAALSGLTILAWALSTWLLDDHGAANRLETTAVLAIAGIKGRLIFREYMEVRSAPRRLRLLADAWLVGLLVLLLGIYVWG
jgi:hypothetical protein